MLRIADPGRPDQHRPARVRRRRDPRLRQRLGRPRRARPVRRDHDAPGHPGPLGPVRRAPRDLAALRRGGPHERPGVRRLDAEPDRLRGRRRGPRAGYLTRGAAARRVPDVRARGGVAHGVPPAQVEGRHDRLPHRLRRREAALPRVHAGARRRRLARVQRARGRRALGLATDRRRARPVRAARPGDRHGPGDAAGVPGVRRVRAEGREPVPRARARDGPRPGDRGAAAPDRQRDDRGRRVAVDRRRARTTSGSTRTPAARTTWACASRWDGSPTTSGSRSSASRAPTATATSG